MQNIKKVFSSLTVILFFILLLLIVFFTFTINPDRFLLKQQPPNSPDFHFKEVKITHIDNGQKIFNLEAQEAFIYKENNSFELNQIFGEIYDNETIRLLIEAPKGNLNLAESSIQLDNAKSVYISESSPIALQMDSLDWELASFVGVGLGNVRILNDSFSMKSDQIMFDLKKEKLKIKDNIVLDFENKNDEL
tara:strand:+ start:332 stop:907 length:576 start_codon:yes stop_codon:yes gene_type:complete